MLKSLLPGSNPEPKLPPMPSAPPPVSQIYAEAFEHVKKLESKLATTVEQWQEQLRRADVAERSLEEAKKFYLEQIEDMRKNYTEQRVELENEARHLRNERDHCQKEYAAIRARLNAVAAMLLPNKVEPTPEPDMKQLEETLIPLPQQG